jgi:hypothetical protein
VSIPGISGGSNLTPNQDLQLTQAILQEDYSRLSNAKNENDFDAAKKSLLGDLSRAIDDPTLKAYQGVLQNLAQSVSDAKFQDSQDLQDLNDQFQSVAQSIRSQ